MSDPRDHEVGFDLLSAYLDGEIDEQTRATVEARLSALSEWRAELETVRGARDLVRALPLRETPAGFWDEVSSRVANDEAPNPHAAIPRAARRIRRPGRLVGAVAAAAAVIAVVVLPGRPEVRPNVAAVVTRHGAQSADAGDPISTLAPVGPLAGLRR